MNMPMMVLLVIMVIVMHGVDSNDRVAVAGSYEGRGAGAWTSSSFLFCTACLKGIYKWLKVINTMMSMRIRTMKMRMRKRMML